MVKGKKNNKFFFNKIQSQIFWRREVCKSIQFKRRAPRCPLVFIKSERRIVESSNKCKYLHEFGYAAIYVDESLLSVCFNMHSIAITNHYVTQLCFVSNLAAVSMIVYSPWEWRIICVVLIIILLCRRQRHNISKLLLAFHQSGTFTCVQPIVCIKCYKCLFTLSKKSKHSIEVYIEEFTKFHSTWTMPVSWINDRSLQLHFKSDFNF